VSSVVKKIMPTDLTHLIGIAAPAETIYRAITTEGGIRAWWTTAVKMDASAGGVAALSPFNVARTDWFDCRNRVAGARK
jgi:uncharacterized protein YndB with AHSA1/START domain